MRKYAARFVSVTCIGSLYREMPKNSIYGLYVIKGVNAEGRVDQRVASSIFEQDGKRLEYIKSIKKSGDGYVVALTDGLHDYSSKFSAHQPARLAIPNQMLGLTKQDFQLRKPSTAVVPQHHIDEAIAEGWGKSIFWIIVVFGIFGMIMNFDI